MEEQKILNSKSNPEQKGQQWRYHNMGLQILLPSHNLNSTKTNGTE
jgi:hypothetical protein